MNVPTRRYMRGAIAAACLFAAMPSSQAATIAPTKTLTNVKNVIVWQKVGRWLIITEDLPVKGRTCYYYDPAYRTKLNLKKPLLGNWQPLGSAIKWLMYIDRVNGLDRLMAHDVDYHSFSIADPSSQNQIGCGMVDTRCIFGEYRAVRVGACRPVDMYCINMVGGDITPFCVSDSEKSQFAHDGNLMVYRAVFPDGSAAICGHYFNEAGECIIASRNGIEPAVCGNLVAWAEVSGVGWNIMAMDITTGEIRTIAFTKANPPCPEVGKGSIFWQDMRNSKTGLDIYGYDWATKREFAVSNAAGNQMKLRACDDMVTWVTGATNYQTLWRAKIVPGK